jgi:hypothetical protein
MLYRVHLALSGFELATSVVMGSDCIGSCKFGLLIGWSLAKLYILCGSQFQEEIHEEKF